MRKHSVLLTMCTVMSLLLAGCSTAKPAPTAPKKAAAPAAVHKNGTIASMKKVHVEGQNPNINIYDMFYWSEGKKVEAYVTEPKNPGPNEYPLEVNCHGGYAGAIDLSHADSPVSLSLIKGEFDRIVVIYPQYRGYANSQGTVQGLYGDTVDTENAIQAAYSLPTVDDAATYLLGTSMGGGVVMRVAANPQYAKNIHAVVALSPFVGWNTMMQWAEKNKQTSHVADTWVQYGVDLYGSFDPSKLAYKENSIDVAKIGAPVLLLQGTADQRVPWQSVQFLYQQMKANDITAKFDLYPGGHHGLHTGKYQTESDQAIGNWLAQFR